MNVSLCAGPNCTGSNSDVPPAVGSAVCAACHRALLADLVELPRLYDECGPALLPRRNPTMQRVSGSRPAGGILIDEDAIATRSNIVGCLASWAALVADELGTARPSRRHPADLAAYLTRHLTWLLGHPAAADFVAEIRQVTAHARRSVHPGSPLRMELGQCVQPDCDAPMVTDTALSSSRDGHTHEVRCAAGHTWQPHQWLHVLRQLQRSRRAEGVR